MRSNDRGWFVASLEWTPAQGIRLDLLFFTMQAFTVSSDSSTKWKEEQNKPLEWVSLKTTPGKMSTQLSVWLHKPKLLPRRWQSSYVVPKRLLQTPCCCCYCFCCCCAVVAIFTAFLSEHSRDYMIYAIVHWSMNSVGSEQPHAVFGGLITISGGWIQFGKKPIVSEDSR